MNTEPSEASPQEQQVAASNGEPAENPATNSSPDSQPAASSLEPSVGSASSDAVAHTSAPGDSAAGESPEKPVDQDATQPSPDEPSHGVPQSEPGDVKADGPKPAGLRAKIQVGSRRDKSKGERSPKPKVVGAEKPMKIGSPSVPILPAAPVPAPSARDPLTPDLERELEAAMGEASLDEILGEDSGAQPLPMLESESRHKVNVIRIHGDDVFFSLGGRHEGVASLRQFSEPPTLGAEMDVLVKSFNAEDGLYELVLPGASLHVEDWSDLVEGSVVEARITGANTGGLECKVGTVRGFIPSSQIAMFRVEDYAEFLDQKLLCIVSEVNRRRKNLVLSRRAVLEREKEEARKKLLESLEVGQVVEGVVRNIRDFGAFVDLGGIDGLVHISQLSWDRVNHPSEVFEEGQKVRVKIEKVDLQTGKVGLSYRDLLEHPWVNIEEKFAVETVVKGAVSQIAKFGAFVKLAAGIEGLVHISELSHARVPTVSSVVSEGQEVEVKVLSIDADAQRIALSIKAVLPEPPPEEPEVAAREPAREEATRKRQTPLKGGTDRSSGGEHFGLKW